jgi:Zn-dependent peptidase ImmA (M78 family)
MIKNLKLQNKVESYSPTVRDGYNYNFEIAEEYIPDYRLAVAALGRHYQWLVDAFHTKYPNPPFRWEDFLDFMKDEIGIEVTVKCNKDGGPDFAFAGTWKWDDQKKKAITIYVNSKHPESKRKVSIIHECIHAIQDLDQEFKEELDTYPHSIIVRIADRVAEKTAISVVLPDRLATAEKLNGLNAYQIACKYDVSAELASYA